MRLAWTTDAHLNFLSAAGRRAFIAELAALGADAVLVGGDVGEADDFAACLLEIAAAVDRPVFFVLGNHDFYRGSIPSVRAAARALCAAERRLVWLSDAGVVRLTDRTALVGHDGWGDGRAGDFLQSSVRLNDQFLIADLSAIAPVERVHDPEAMLALRDRLNELGDEVARHFRRVLPEALGCAECVIVLTHVPPFREACVYNGRISDDDWAPYFTCVAAGEVLDAMMRQHPHRRMTVLCGHTHGGAHTQILDNLEVITGGAEYRKPEVQQVLTVE